MYYYICKASVPPCIRDDERNWVANLTEELANNDDFADQLHKEVNNEYDLDRLISQYRMYEELKCM